MRLVSSAHNVKLLYLMFSRRVTPGDPRMLLPPVLLLAASLAPGLRAAISVDGMWSPWSTVKVSWGWSTHNRQ